jgi:hypothetical protein
MGPYGRAFETGMVGELVRPIGYLHAHVLAAAQDFLLTGGLSPHFMKSVGVSFKNSPEFEEYKKMKAISRKLSSDTGVYSSLDGDGEAIYMGDGMWLNADDSYSDRGR